MRSHYSGLVVDRNGYVSEADREASLFMAGHNVHLSPAAAQIVEDRLRRDPVQFAKFVGGAHDVLPYQQRIIETFESSPPPRKFKHNRRG